MPRIGGAACRGGSVPASAAGLHPAPACVSSDLVPWMAAQIDVCQSSSQSSNSDQIWCCNICLEMARNPVITVCGHLYWWVCQRIPACSRLFAGDSTDGCWCARTVAFAFRSWPCIYKVCPPPPAHNSPPDKAHLGLPPSVLAHVCVHPRIAVATHISRVPSLPDLQGWPLRGGIDPALWPRAAAG